MTEQYIQFIANYNDWVAIKKLKIEGKADPKIVMEFLAGLNNSLDDNVAKNLALLVDLPKLDAALNEFDYGKKAGDLATILAAVASIKINKVINEITDPLSATMQKKEIKSIQDFCKVYAMRSALKKCGLAIDYSNIALPGKRKSKKKA